MDISLDDSSIVIKCETESEIMINTPDPINSGESVLIEKYSGKREVKYNITGTEHLLWIKITNSTGSAISQPFYITKL